MKRPTKLAFAATVGQHATPNHAPGALALAALVCVLSVAPAMAAESFPEEFRVKRAEVFEFSRQPTIRVAGDRVEITFASKAHCDVTVAIEDAQGHIVRHLACGLLGPQAPAPLAPNSLEQTLVWDGKDDAGRYIDNRSELSVRVSLGLKAQFERTLFWEPKKRIGKANSPQVTARPEGVYVFEGEGVDLLRLFDHEGNYVRTIYPFPAARLAEVQGLDLQEFPQSGQSLPVKHGPKHHATLLTSGDNMLKTPGKYGAAASAMAVHQDRIVLAGLRINRLATDGTTGGKPLEGPVVSFEQEPADNRGGADDAALPRSAALSPDGRWLYLTGYVWNRGYPRGYAWLHGVARIDLTSDAPLETFVGKLDRQGDGVGPGEFRCPTSVACDSAGRVYVGDYMNDRIQVFSPAGEHLKSIPVKNPSVIQIDDATQEIYVFSWFLTNRFLTTSSRIPATLVRLGPLDDPKPRFTTTLPLNKYSDRVGLRWTGLEFNAAVDSHTKPATIWLVPGKPGTTEQLEILRGKGGDEGQARLAHLRMLVEREGKLVEIRNFGEEAAQSVKRTKPPVISRQRLYVNPANGRLYIGEGDSGVMKSYKQLVEIDPLTGEVELVDLPFTAEDMCFGIDGTAFLRTDTIVARYDSRSWREIPWDYGEEREHEGFDGSVKTASVISALVLPASGRPGHFHLGGMSVNAKGHLAVACYNHDAPIDRREFQSDGSLSSKWASTSSRKYTPNLFPGRVRFGEVHVWDEHGQVLYEDAIPGLEVADGIAIGSRDNLYAMASAHRIVGGKPYFLPWTETLLKMAPRGGKVISNGERASIPAAGDALPGRSPDMANHVMRNAWIDGVKWKYGGVGFGSKTGGCICWNARFALDHFDRTFAPEIDHFSVAVLDSSGSVILRIGRYGNVDDGQPLVAAGGPPSTHRVGGDEVALFHAAYVVAHTDHRLFIADAGNRRVLSVKLDYHQSQRLPLGESGAAPQKGN